MGIFLCVLKALNRKGYLDGIPIAQLFYAF